MSAAGTKSFYICRNSECSHMIGTIQRDTGETPLEVHCDKCQGMMRFQLKAKPTEGAPIVTREWYKPTEEELKAIIADTLRRQFATENRTFHRSKAGKKEMMQSAKSITDYANANGLLERPLRGDLTASTQ